MKMASLAQINQKIKATISPQIELVRGEGYHYLVYDNGADIYETESIYVPYTNIYTLKEWVKEAQDFFEKQR
jgi:hypothetical protein